MTTGDNLSESNVAPKATEPPASDLSVGGEEHLVRPNEEAAVRSETTAEADEAQGRAHESGEPLLPPMTEDVGPHEVSGLAEGVLPGTGDVSRQGGAGHPPSDPQDDMALVQAVGVEARQSEVGVTPLRPQIVVEAPPRQVKRHLPNAQVGVAYEQDVHLGDFDSLTILAPQESFDLHLDLESGTVSGTPQTAGQFHLELSGMQASMRVVVSIIVDVIPDPRSLWKNIPSSPEAPFWKREEAAEVHHWDLRVAAASKRGRSHAHEGSFRDDDFAVAQTRPEGWYVACVADGAGSSKYSRRASEIVANLIARRLGASLESTPALADEQIGVALDALDSNPDEAIPAIKSWAYKPMLGEAISAAEALKEERLLIGCEQSDLYTTVLFAAAKRYGNRYLVLSFGIGDGGMAIWDPSARQVKSLFTPEGGEFAGQTRFLRLDEFQDQELNVSRLGVGVMDAGTHTVLMTDGITDAMFPAEIDLENEEMWSSFWSDELGPRLDFSEDASTIGAGLLDWLDFWSKSNHDDRTIAVMHNPGN